MSITTPPLTNPVAALYQHCGICDIEQNLLRCTGCKLIRYCSKDHQTAHWVEHKYTCTAIRKLRTKLEGEEQALRTTPNNGFMQNGNPFVTGVGHFWGLFHTRDYMRARYRLAEAILGVKTLDAVESALDHFMDMLRLCREDNLGVRSHVPSLFLRLGKDQECYDFVKWWATIAQASDYDWGDTSLPYLDIKNADIFEPADVFCQKHLELSFVVSVALLKIRLFLAIKECLQNTAVLRKSGLLPTEIVDHIQDELLRSVLGGKWDDKYSAQCSQLLDTLSSQVDTLYEAVERANRHFWPALLNTERHLEADMDAYGYGSVEVMQLVLNISIDSWRESPKAVQLIATKR